MRHSTRREAGFTLLELLVVLVLFGMLSITVFAALRLGSMTLNGVTNRQAGATELTDSAQLLTRLVEAAYPEYIPPSIPGSPGRIDFDGEPDRIAFLTAAPMSISPGGLARMQVAVDVNSKSLVIAARPELAWPDARATTQETLVAGLAAADFAYFGADSPQQSGYWHRRWASRATLPALIRITVRFPAEDRRHWPELLLAPKISADESCQFSTLTQSCLGR